MNIKQNSNLSPSSNDEPFLMFLKKKRKKEILGSTNSQEQAAAAGRISRFDELKLLSFIFQDISRAV